MTSSRTTEGQDGPASLDKADSVDSGNSAENSAPGTEVAETPSALITPDGRTSVADIVVEKIAAIATREVTGVHKMGSGTARALGAVRERIPGSRASMGHGVTVEVGERQAAVDLEFVMEYGAEIGELSRAVRRNVIDSIERMTALQVTEVNIAILDVFVPGDEEDVADPRVR